MHVNIIVHNLLSHKLVLLTELSSSPYCVNPIQVWIKVKDPLRAKNWIGGKQRLDLPFFYMSSLMCIFLELYVWTRMLMYAINFGNKL